MRRRRIILVLTLAAVAAGLVLCWPRGPKEPVYQGKRLSLWVEQALYDRSAQKQDDARKVLKAIGTNGVPYLLYQFTRPDSKLGAAYNRWADQRPGSGTSYEVDRKRVRTATLGLMLLGPGVTPALPALADYLGDRDRCADAAHAMSGAGEAALPHFRIGLASTNSTAAQMSAVGLARVAEENESAVPELIQLLQHTNASIRGIAAVYLRGITSKPGLVVPALIALLSDSDWEIRRDTAESLGDRGEVAKAALSELRRLMNDSNRDVAWAASNAVFHIDPATQQPRGP
jgi:HEAT repeat protein